jgi:lysophospholipase L1-like esterase
VVAFSGIIGAVHASWWGRLSRALVGARFSASEESRLILQRTVVSLAISLLVGPIWADNNDGKKLRYLALGDSLAFGYNPLVQPPNLSLYIGYPKMVAGVEGLGLANASCPGETTSTFIGTSSVYYPGFDCVTMQQQKELFVPYDGAQNQLDYALDFLKANRSTKLVTIDIGVNDIGILQYNCTVQYSGDPQGLLACEQNGLPGTLATIGQNLGTIFAALRATGYKNTIVAVDAFAFNYSDPVQTAALGAFNTLTGQVASQFGVEIADVYPVFQKAAAPFGGDTCAAGLLVKLSDGTCDTHPNLVGQALVAATVLKVIEPRH